MHHNDTVTLAQFGLNNTFKKGDISAMLDKYIDKNTLLDKRKLCDIMAHLCKSFTPDNFNVLLRPRPVNADGTVMV